MQNETFPVKNQENKQIQNFEKVNDGCGGSLRELVGACRKLLEVCLHVWGSFWGGGSLRELAGANRTLMGKHSGGLWELAGAYGNEVSLR